MLGLACLAALTVAAAPAAAAPAPGRVAFSVATKVPVSNVDAGGAGPAVALPDGRVAMIAYGPGADLALVQLRADGSLDPAFGSAGIARVAVPGGGFNAAQLLRQPDGRLLVVGTVSTPANRFALTRFVLVRLTAAGAPDPSFGANGIAALDLQSSCGRGCSPAALTADRGRLLAQDVAAIYAAGRTTVRIPLTTTGRRILRRSRSLRVGVGRDFRDILTARDRGVTNARLR